MTVSNEPLKGPLGWSTDTTASKLTILPNPAYKGSSVPATFNSSFDLKLVLTDPSTGKSNTLTPMIFHVAFTTTVTGTGTQTTAVSLYADDDSPDHDWQPDLHR